MCKFITALVLLKRQKSVAAENRYLETVEPRDDPDFRVAVQNLKQTSKRAYLRTSCQRLTAQGSSFGTPCACQTTGNCDCVHTYSVLRQLPPSLPSLFILKISKPTKSWSDSRLYVTHL